MFFWKIIVFLRLLLKKECNSRYQEKFAITKRRKDSPLETIWVHAVSIGEMNSAEILIRELSKRFFIVLTTTSLTSARLAEKFKFDNFIHQFNPVDWPHYVNKFIQHWSVKKAIFIESEFWPFTIYCTAKVADVYLINARFSEKSYKRWYILKHIFFKRVLSLYKEIHPSGNFSREKFKSFGVKNISENINTKIFNREAFVQKTKDQKSIFQNLKIFLAKKRIFAFISLHLTEVETIMPLIRKILQKKSNTILILPRKIQESQKIRDCVLTYLEQDVGKDFIKIYNQNYEQHHLFTNEKVIVLDEMGIAPFVYDISEYCFVCGSFVRGIGGHNPLEGLFLYKKCYFGSFYEKNTDLIEDLKVNNFITILKNDDFKKIDFTHLTSKEEVDEFKKKVDDFFFQKEKDFNKFLEKFIKHN